MSNVQALEDAKRFAKENLVQCCEELIELSATGVLCNGKVRELRKMVDFAGPAALSVAETIVKQAAMEIVVATSRETNV